MAEKYNATHLSMLNMQKQAYDNPNFLKNSKQMVSLSIIINDSAEEVNKLLSTNKGSDQWTIYGNKGEVKEQIYSLKDFGVTDILINSHPDDKNSSLIHLAVKEMIGEQNGIK